MPSHGYRQGRGTTPTSKRRSVIKDDGPPGYISPCRPGHDLSAFDGPNDVSEGGSRSIPAREFRDDDDDDDDEGSIFHEL